MRKKPKTTVSTHALVLMFYDLVMLALVSVLLLVFYPSSYYPITRVEALLHYLLAAACMLGARALGNSYNNVWRYGGNNLYVNLICYDVLGGGVYFILQRLLPLRDVEFLRAVTWGISSCGRFTSICTMPTAGAPRPLTSCVP